MEVIYINDNYSPMHLGFYKRTGTTRPTLNAIYAIREVIKPSGKEGYGILLEQLINPKVEIMHPILHQIVKVEVSWNINRFTDLQGNVLTSKMIKGMEARQNFRNKMREIGEMADAIQ